ncbi:TPA: DUF1642 domain-containing protein [Streptococcus pneumoniae]
MNKQELIKAIKNEPYEKGIFVDTIKFNRNWLLRKIEKLDEPKKVKIPQFVAEIIEYYKGQNATLYDALREKNFNKQYNEWLMNEQDAYNKVARAWLDGYETEKEKRYLVKLKGMNRINGCLANNKKLGTWYFGISGNSKNHRTNHTRKELEEANFGWVFDCEGVEVEEVE